MMAASIDDRNRGVSRYGSFFPLNAADRFRTDGVDRRRWIGEQW
jgi:hypothetical protein